MCGTICNGARQRHGREDWKSFLDVGAKKKGWGQCSLATVNGGIVSMFYIVHSRSGLLTASAKRQLLPIDLLSCDETLLTVAYVYCRDDGERFKCTRVRPCADGIAQKNKYLNAMSPRFSKRPL